MKILRWFAPRLDPEELPEHDPDLASLQAESDRTLRRVEAVLSDRQRRIALAVGGTSDAVRRTRAKR